MLASYEINKTFVKKGAELSSKIQQNSFLQQTRVQWLFIIKISKLEEVLCSQRAEQELSSSAKNRNETFTG